MKKGLDKQTRIDLNGQFPYAVKNGSKANGSPGKSKEKHPYMREGFVFKCCHKHNDLNSFS